MVKSLNQTKNGHVDQELMDGDYQAKFLRLGACPHHLYMWQLFDEERIFYYTMARIPPDFKVSSSFVPITLSGNSNEISLKRKRQAEMENQYAVQQKQNIEQQEELVRSLKKMTEVGNVHLAQEKNVCLD